MCEKNKASVGMCACAGVGNGLDRAAENFITN